MGSDGHVVPCPECEAGKVEVCEGPRSWIETCQECQGVGVLTCEDDECSLCPQVTEDLEAMC